MVTHLPKSSTHTYMRDLPKMRHQASPPRKPAHRKPRRRARITGRCTALRHLCGMRTMTLHSSRARAERAFQLRSLGWSWNRIAAELDFKSHGAAQTAVKRHEQRVGSEPVESTRRSLIESARITTTVLFDRFAAAADRGDDRAIALLNGELCRNRDQLAKLTGAYAPERSEVDLNVRQTPSQIIADAQARLLAVIEGEVINAPKGIES